MGMSVCDEANKVSMNTIGELLAANRDAIVKDWFHHILDTYPPETAKLWKKGGDPFHNPVAVRSHEAAAAVVDYLVESHDENALEKVLEYLDELVRVRAVQNFTPSQAAGFIFLLKKSVRETLWNDLTRLGVWEEFVALESRIDGLALACLDLYAKCREKLYEIRLGDLKREYTQLLKRAQIVVGVSGEEPAR